MADCAAPMHVARRRVFGRATDFSAAKSVKFENKKATVLELKFV
jgi:hypothetical protein